VITWVNPDFGPFWALYLSYCFDDPVWKMKFVFGPIPSRRLGQSLGIDPLPLKTCNWNCVYCQLGRTQPLINARSEYQPSGEIVAEVRQALDAHKPGEIDWVTFVGSGETMLHSKVGWMVQQVKEMTRLPVAVITNGSLLYLSEVRQELIAADAVLPTLDAGTAELYRLINRPHPKCAFERLLDGLVAFREEYLGKLWVEVMLVRGLNDTPQALWDIARALEQVKPDAVHINLPTRPPVETWVQPPHEESLIQAVAILGNIAEVVHTAEGAFDLSGCDSLVDAIIAIITRHPMRQEELERALSRWSPGHVDQVLADLRASGRAQLLERYGVRFWSAAASRYPGEAYNKWKMPAGSPREEQKSKSQQGEYNENRSNYR
jgi:wyosine [tRNA(Phe)-imidazoG37] synthetase (radical SAM superfamily)